MNVQTPARGKKIAEGKTKALFEIGGGFVEVVSKDDITAGDGAKHDLIENKAELANKTTCLVFDLLKACGIPLAYEQYMSPTSFKSRKANMLLFEVVTRRVAKGSCLKRYPDLVDGTVFENLRVELFLKTTDKKFKDVAVEKDDPYISGYSEKGVMICRPDLPPGKGNESVLVPADTVYAGKMPDFKVMERMARQVFLVLEKAWSLLGCTLCDMKIEFGTAVNGGELVVADVIDNDSWRTLDQEGAHLDKQLYRDGASIAVVKNKYERVAQLVEGFAPFGRTPRIVLWRASLNDDIKPFEDSAKKLGVSGFLSEPLSRSVHKSPELSLKMFRAELHSKNVPTVAIVYVGRSNGAGPTLACETHVPVITVPQSFKEFPEDVWSSLRTPSDNPLMTVLEPGNALQAALCILSETSPHAYMARRLVLENYRLEPADSPSLDI